MADEKTERPVGRLVNMVEVIANEGGRRVAYYYSQAGTFIFAVELGPPATKGEGA